MFSDYSFFQNLERAKKGKRKRARELKTQYLNGLALRTPTAQEKERPSEKKDPGTQTERETEFNKN